jgi:elongation factor P
MKTVEELRASDVIHLSDGLWRVEAVTRHAAVGKMGGAVFVTLRHLETGREHEQRFKPGEKVAEVTLEKRRVEYLYSDSSGHWFMDVESFEQVCLSPPVVGPRARFLRPELELTVAFCEGRPVDLLFPEVVELRVTSTAPPTRGDADSVAKEAELENGLKVLVPQFVKTGDRVRVETRTGKYKDRVR